MIKMYLEYYLQQLNYQNLPKFIIKYLNTPSLQRLKNIGYFCGMDYASKDIYSFREYISRYDHSLTVSLITYKLTEDKKVALAGLFHDIATPCFSHVIDYMNEDYEKQESTEEYTELILKKDNYLYRCLEKDKINIDDIINFKKYTIVDNNRPKLCADRIDGVILNAIGWTKNISKQDINSIIKNICIFKNEDNEEELGFKSLEVANKVIEINKKIDLYCQSKEDNYMMQLLASITKKSIKKKYITYEDLYTYNEKDLLFLLKNKKDNKLQQLIKEFETKKREEISEFNIPKIKKRSINPLVNGKRINSMR